MVFPAGVYFYPALRTGSDAAIVAPLVAAWLRCDTKSPPTSSPTHLPPLRLLPLMVHVVPGRLLASPIAAHPTDTASDL